MLPSEQYDAFYNQSQYRLPSTHQTKHHHTQTTMLTTHTATAKLTNNGAWYMQCNGFFTHTTTPYSHNEAIYIYTQHRLKDTPQERLTHTHNAADVYTYYNDAL